MKILLVGCNHKSMPNFLVILEVNCLRLAQAAAVSNARLVTGAKTKAAPHLATVKDFLH